MMMGHSWFGIRGDSMQTDHAAMRECHGAAHDLERVGLKLMKPVLSAGCLIVSLPLTSTTATAHVKWFVNCNVSDAPLPAQAVLTATFLVCFALFLALLYLGCIAERTTLGSSISQLLDHHAAALHRRADDLLRSVAAVSFALLWADGGLIITPELKASSIWLSAIQLLIPMYMFGRATLPAAGVGIIVLYGYGVATYGLFHMLDYPVFVGLGVFFALSVSQNTKLLAFRFDLLRWTVACTLLWPSIEKFVYPGWVAPIAITHPEITLGFDVATVVTAAGVVEFGLSFALFWTPLVRRFAALALIAVLTAATFDFGKVDGIGHLMIITILLVVFAHPGGTHDRRHPALAPLAGGMTLAAVILLYTGSHALYYGSKSASVAPLLSGAALLTLILLCVPGRAQLLCRIAVTRLSRWRVSGNERHDGPNVSSANASASSSDVVPRRRRQDASAESVGPPQRLRHPETAGL
jgi:hypothetical protein